MWEVSGKALPIPRTDGRLVRVAAYDGDRAVAAGRLQVVALAIAPDGEVCGFSDLRVDRHDPRHASVGGTLVLPGHRGHRLGLAMKLATTVGSCSGSRAAPMSRPGMQASTRR